MTQRQEARAAGSHNLKGKKSLSARQLSGTHESKEGQVSIAAAKPLHHFKASKPMRRSRSSAEVCELPR